MLLPDTVNIFSLPELKLLLRRSGPQRSGFGASVAAQGKLVAIAGSAVSSASISSCVTVLREKLKTVQVGVCTVMDLLRMPVLIGLQFPPACLRCCSYSRSVYSTVCSCKRVLGVLLECVRAVACCRCFARVRPCRCVL